MSRYTSPVVAVACALGACCLLVCQTLHVYAARQPAPIRCVSCLRPAIARANVACPVTAAYAPDGAVASGQVLAAVAPGDADPVGRPMPPLEFERRVDAGDTQRAAAKATLYRWWTDGCPHCEKTLPAVEALRKKYGPKGLRVVAVYHPKPPRDVSDADIREAAKRMGYGGVIALDQDWSELKKFYLDTGDRPATSASFLVDREGVIRHVHPGPRFFPSEDPASAKEDADYRRLEGAVRQLLRD